MKILHLLINYHPSVGGTQLLYKGISERCVSDYNDSVDVYTIDSLYGSHSRQFEEIKVKEEIINGVHVKRFPFFRKHLKLVHLCNKFFAKLGIESNMLAKAIAGPISHSLQKAMRNTDAEVISASPSGFTYMSYPLIRHKLKNPKPFVYQGAFHFGDPSVPHIISAETIAAIKASEYYLCNTNFEKNKLVELGVPEEIIVVTGVATDMSIFENGDARYFRNKFKLKSTDILLGYVGRLSATKSIKVLIDAFVDAYKHNSNLALVLAGFKSDYAFELMRYIESFSEECKQRIFWEFNIDDKQKVDIFHALDIFILPSINESFGIVFLEAWSCKKPVIGAAIGAIESVIDDGINGLLMQPNNSKDLCEKILYLTDNIDLRKEMGERGYTKTKENFTWDVITAKFRDTYSKAIQKFNNKYSS